MVITMRAANSFQSGDMASFAVGDSVVLHYKRDEDILTSDPPVYPVTGILILKK
jgi:hypothetical protein